MSTISPSNDDPDDQLPLRPPGLPPPLILHKSLFLIVSAQALSTFGIGLSILAIWVQWLVPSITPDPPPPPPPSPPRRNHHHHHHHHKSPSSIRSSSPTSTTSSSSSSTPTPLLSIIVRGGSTQHHAKKHVSFVDLPTKPLAADQSVVPQPTPIDEPTVHVKPLTEEPFSPTLSLSLISPPEDDPPPPNPSQQPSQVQLLSLRSEPLGSEDSFESDEIASCKLTKIKNSLLGKRRRSSLPDNNIHHHHAHHHLVQNPKFPLQRTDSLSSETSKHSRRCSTILLRPWTPPRNRKGRELVPSASTVTAAEDEDDASAAASRSGKSRHTLCRTDSSSSSHGFFRRSSHRRKSASVPPRRTLPYEAPYFATPPLPIQHHHHLHTHTHTHVVSLKTQQLSKSRPSSSSSHTVTPIAELETDDSEPSIESVVQDVRHSRILSPQPPGTGRAPTLPNLRVSSVSGRRSMSLDM